MTCEMTEGYPEKFDQVSAHMKLAQFLTEQYISAGEFQHAMVEISRDTDQPLEAENKVVYDWNGNRHVPGEHDRIVFGPKHGDLPDPHIAKVAVRFPIIAGGEQWNDTFLQVWNRRGRSVDYLFNSQGLIPFRDAQTDVVPTLAYGQAEENRDFYMVRDILALPIRRQTTVKALNQIFERYFWHPQAYGEL